MTAPHCVCTCVCHTCVRLCFVCGCVLVCVFALVCVARVCVCALCGWVFMGVCVLNGVGKKGSNRKSVWTRKGKSERPIGREGETATGSERRYYPELKKLVANLECIKKFAWSCRDAEGENLNEAYLDSFRFHILGQFFFFKKVSKMHCSVFWSIFGPFNAADFLSHKK